MMNKFSPPKGYWDEDHVWVYQCHTCSEYFKGEAILEHRCPNEPFPCFKQVGPHQLEEVK